MFRDIVGTMGNQMQETKGNWGLQVLGFLDLAVPFWGLMIRILMTWVLMRAPLDYHAPAETIEEGWGKIVLNS